MEMLLSCCTELKRPELKRLYWACSFDRTFTGSRDSTYSYSTLILGADGLGSLSSADVSQTSLRVLMLA